MKFARILFLLTAASISGAHAATLCCDLAGSGDAFGILREGAGNVTLGSTASYGGSGNIGGGLVAVFATTSPGSAVTWLTESNSVGRASLLSSGSMFEWNIGATPGQVFNFDDPNWSVLSGGSIGVMTSPWESVFNLTAPTTVVSGAIPEPSSVAISALLVAAGLLRRRVA